MLNPANSAHSIKAIAFVCEFDRAISSEGIAVVLAEAKRFRKKLLLREPIRNIELQFQGSAKLLQRDDISGYRFSTKAPDNTDAVWYEVSGNRAIFCTAEYVTFSGFSAEVSYYLELACKAFSTNGAVLSRAILEYRDEFTSDSADWPPYETLRENNEYVVKAAVQQGKLWHSHAGFYTDTDKGLILDNIRIEHETTGTEQDDDVQYRLSMTLTHILTPLAPLEAGAEDVPAQLSSILIHLRKHHKLTFSKIITDELARTIGLKSESEATQ